MGSGLVLTCVAIFGLMNLALGYMAATVVERRKAAAEDRLVEAATQVAETPTKASEEAATEAESAEEKPKRKVRPRPKKKRSFSKKNASPEEKEAAEAAAAEKEKQEAAQAAKAEPKPEPEAAEPPAAVEEPEPEPEPDTPPPNEPEAADDPPTSGNEEESADLQPAARGAAEETELKTSDREVKASDELKQSERDAKQQEQDELDSAKRGVAPEEAEQESKQLNTAIEDEPLKTKARTEEGNIAKADEAAGDDGVIGGQVAKEVASSDEGDLDIGPLADLVGVCHRLGDEAELSREELVAYANAPDVDSFQGMIEELDEFCQRALGELRGGVANIKTEAKQTQASERLEALTEKLNNLLENIKDLNYDKKSQQESFSKLKSSNNKICNELKEFLVSLESAS